jgi:hypothetical protein
MLKAEVKSTSFDKFVLEYWVLFFSVSLIVLIVAIGLLFLKGGIPGSILATLILIKIWEV